MEAGPPSRAALLAVAGPQLADLVASCLDATTETMHVSPEQAGEARGSLACRCPWPAPWPPPSGTHCVRDRQLPACRARRPTLRTQSSSWLRPEPLGPPGPHSMLCWRRAASGELPEWPSGLQGGAAAAPAALPTPRPASQLHPTAGLRAQAALCKALSTPRRSNTLEICLGCTLAAFKPSIALPGFPPVPARRLEEAVRELGPAAAALEAPLASVLGGSPPLAQRLQLRELQQVYVLLTLLMKKARVRGQWSQRAVGGCWWLWGALWVCWPGRKLPCGAVPHVLHAALQRSVWRMTCVLSGASYQRTVANTRVTRYASSPCPSPPCAGLV